MAMLALAEGAEAEFSGAAATLPLDRQTAMMAAARGGETVLVYRVVGDAMLLVIGYGRIARIDFMARPDGPSVVLSDYVAMAWPVSWDEEARLPGAAALEIADDRFEEILRRGTGGIEEAQAAFAPPTTIDTYLAIHDQVLRNWDYRCAVTGLHDPPRDGRKSRLEVTAIRPREFGGPLHVSNYLPLAPIAAHAFAHGVISVGHRLDIVAVQNRLEADLLEQMDSSGRLQVPAAPAAWPDFDHLTYHREHVFAR